MPRLLVRDIQPAQVSAEIHSFDCIFEHGKKKQTLSKIQIGQQQAIFLIWYEAGSPLLSRVARHMLQEWLGRRGLGRSTAHSMPKPSAGVEKLS